MLWFVKVFFLAGGSLILQSAWAFLDGMRFLRLIRSSRTKPLGNYAPFASVLIPCKGVHPGFDANVDGFLKQDYANFEVIFVVATPQDLAYQNLRTRLETRKVSASNRKPQMSLVVAGLSDTRGEKVNNLLRGIEAVDEAAMVLVFADIDAAPAPDWLRSIVAPLSDPSITVSTGFRWYLPGKGFASRLRAAWDTSIATMMRDHDHNFAWGGSMAIRAADFCSLRIAERYWANTVSDDYALTRAVRDAGGKIVFQPRCLMASLEESNLWEFLRWSTRQIIITRIYASHLWKLGLATYLFYCGTLALGLMDLVVHGSSASQRAAIAAILLTVILLGAAKGYVRTLVAHELFPRDAGRGSCYWQLTPLVPWVMLSNFLAAGFTRRIVWRGTEYELVSREVVHVRQRAGSE